MTRHFGRLARAHKAAHLQGNLRENLAVYHSDSTATAFYEGICRNRHVGVVVAHHKQVVGVMGHRLRECTVDAQAAHKSRSVRAGGMVALKHESLENVARWIGLQGAVAHGHPHMLLVGDGVATAQANGAHEGSRSLRVARRNAERLLANLFAHMHALGHPVGPGEGAGIEERHAAFCHDSSVNNRSLHAEVFQVLEKHQVSALTGRDTTQLALHLEARGRIDGYHLDGLDGIDAFLHRQAQDIVEVAMEQQGVRVAVIGDEAAETRVNIAPDNGGSKVVQVVPGRTLANLGVHAQARLGHDVLGTHRLMAGAHARGDVGVEPAVTLRHGIMPRHDLACTQGCTDLVHRVVGSRKDAGVIHHLAQAHRIGPGHGLIHLGGVYVGARIFKAGHCRHTTGRGKHELERHALGIGRHLLHRSQASHVACLVRVIIDAHGTVRHNGAGVLGRPHHGALDMHVPVEKARCHVIARSVNHARVGPHAMLRGMGRNTHIGNPTSSNGDVGMFEDLASAHIDETAVANHKVGRLQSLRHTCKPTVALPQRHGAERMQGLAFNSRHGRPPCWQKLGTMILPFCQEKKARHVTRKAKVLPHPSYNSLNLGGCKSGCGNHSKRIPVARPGNHVPGIFCPAHGHVLPCDTARLREIVAVVIAAHIVGAHGLAQAQGAPALAVVIDFNHGTRNDLDVCGLRAIPLGQGRIADGKREPRERLRLRHARTFLPGVGKGRHGTRCCHRILRNRALVGILDGTSQRSPLIPVVGKRHDGRLAGRHHAGILAIGCGVLGHRGFGRCLLGCCGVSRLVLRHRGLAGTRIVEAKHLGAGKHNCTGNK